ncbi:hypothetical protein CCA_00703 [Chlamydia caviae GPIC]|uniref:Uncharacterized protein n=1 Tax=Chlamydia caviae (strain ATCC VR-813 / DSM 19441 / 03DC25 / GPIC) TaxID=227941 RepID=Q822H9_CHLCV|nr:hypothetical protein CCA_00703 [Chlamydia caviae GPIC]
MRINRINAHKHRVLISAVDMPPITINFGGVGKMVIPAMQAPKAKHVDSIVKARIIPDFRVLWLPVGGEGRSFT